MSEQQQTYNEVVNAFYPDAEAESLEAPTEEAASDETPEETEELETDIVEGEEEESEESESSDEETEDEEDVQTVEIDGTEHNLTDINEWKEAHDNVKLMQADCTKKWQEASDLKKDAESQAEKAQELTLELEVLVAEDAEVDLEDLKEYDEVEYYKQKEKIDKRKAKLTELKANQPTQKPVLTQEELNAESQDLFTYDSEWKNGEELTPKFSTDMKNAGKYLQDAGYSQDEVNSFLSHHWKTALDAMKYRNQQSKTKANKKKIIKTPKASKPKASNSKSLSAEEIFYGK